MRCLLRHYTPFSTPPPLPPFLRSLTRRPLTTTTTTTSGRVHVMPARCLGVRTDDHGNSATIQQEPPLALRETCRRVHEGVYAFLGREFAGDGEEEVGSGEAKGRIGGRRLRDVQIQTRRSLGVIGEALERYSLDALSLSYNGGKDCLVLLILYLCALHTHYHKPRTPAQSASPTTTNPPPDTTTPPDFPSELNTVYIPPPHPFPAVETFILSSARTYHLTLSRHPYPMKSAFSTYLTQHPGIQAIFVGTRRTDPHGQNLTAFDPTDRGWPSFMRVHPVVEWHYAEIWAFLRVLEVPYCAVYDEGYTSLGGVGDTWRNPRLRVDGEGGGGGGEGEERFRPAFELVEDEEERLGRER